ncbi:MAG TPA: DinB family protein [Vicinamibacterales bacterium]|nr:DinB family protein [Vicinamibacterales bacterium]
MDPRIAPLTEILRLNTRLFRNCLEGLTDEMAALRPSPSTNHVAFVAAHVTEARFYLLKLFGAECASPLAACLENARGIEDVKRFPPLSEMQRAWTMASHALRDRLADMTAAELDAPIASPFPLPIPDPTGLSLLAFFVQHDSYHIGQLALLRKHAGLPAMQYA